MLAEAEVTWLEAEGEAEPEAAAEEEEDEAARAPTARTAWMRIVKRILMSSKVEMGLLRGDWLVGWLVY